MARLNLVTFNIHKGLSVANRKQTLLLFKDYLKEKHLDFIFLQEVIGDHTHPKKQLPFFKSNAQYEFLASDLYPFFHYGQNATYKKGNHGNAILSKHELQFLENVNLSLNKFEQRGLLHLKAYHDQKTIHVLCTHLNLRQPHRIEQIEKIINYVKKNIPDHEPLIFCGDFNDWTGHLSKILYHRLNLQEAGKSLFGKHLRTFPSYFPVLPLDRIYFRNLSIERISPLVHSGWNKLSDHLALYAEFSY